MVIYPPFRVIFLKSGHEPLAGTRFFTRGKVDWSTFGAEDHTGWELPRAHGGGCEGITPKCPQIP